jgi:hypothetical protein
MEKSDVKELPGRASHDDRAVARVTGPENGLQKELRASFAPPCSELPDDLRALLDRLE